MPLSPAELSVLVGLTALAGGLAGWLVRGVWVAANASRDIDQCVQSVAAIDQRCASQRAEIKAEIKTAITEIKTAITDAIRLSVAEWEASSARRDGVIEREQGVQAERVGQIEKDVQNLFERVRDLEKRQ